LTLAAGQLTGPMLESRAEPHPHEQLACALARLVDRRAADQQRHRDVLERSELGKQVVKLVHEAELAIAQLAALRI
jgi:hypothetical protein